MGGLDHQMRQTPVTPFSQIGSPPTLYPQTPINFNENELKNEPSTSSSVVSHDLFTASLGRQSQSKANMLLTKLDLFPDLIKYDTRGRVYLGSELTSLNIGNCYILSDFLHYIYFVIKEMWLRS